MSSGTYFPLPVKIVEIPKNNGGVRKLGILTVADRVAQMAVVSQMWNEYFTRIPTDIDRINRQ